MSDEFYSTSNIQDCFEDIIKKHETSIYNHLIKIYIHKIKSRITFKIKAEYHLKLLMPRTMQLPGSTKNKITKDKNGENVLHLEITEVILVHFNIN